MKKLLFLMLFLMEFNGNVFAYNFCNKSDTPVSVIVCLSPIKADECLRDMGWSGPFPQSQNQILRRSAGTFKNPAIFVAQHWLINPGSCNGTNWRDLQKNLDDKSITTLYFMAFEALDKTGSSQLNFLTSGPINIQSTITLTGSRETGWQIEEQ